MGDPPQPPALPRPTYVRFGVLAFVCALAAITYLDRQCITTVKEEMGRDLGIAPVFFGIVLAAFSVGYTLLEVPAGWMGDMWGPRRVLIRVVLWWSAFTALTGAVRAFTLFDTGFRFKLGDAVAPIALDAFVVLVVVRFLFGCGEAGAFPNITKVVRTWFPFAERGGAQGAIMMSARLGAAVGPLLVAFLVHSLAGWRPAFWVLGLVGVVWAGFFSLWFRNTPEEMPACNAAERRHIREGQPPASVGRGGHEMPWRLLLLTPNVWYVCLASACSSPPWYFLFYYQADFLKDRFLLTDKEAHGLIGLPFYFGAAACMLGGYFSDVLIRLIKNRRWGRTAVAAAGSSLAGVCLLVSLFLHDAYWAVALFCAASFFNDLTIPLSWTVSGDIGGRYAGSVAGLMNMANNSVPILTITLIPWASQRLGWSWTVGLLVGFWFLSSLAWLGVNPTRPLVPEPAVEVPPSA